jgi:hypothetical protein
MKKVFFIPFLILSFFTFSSCEKDDSLDPRPVLEAGNYVRLDITKKRLNFDELTTTTFGGTLTAPGNKVVLYNLYVRKKDIYGFATDFKLIKTVTTFPFELSITPNDIATALNVDISTLVFGDNYRFYGESFDANGNRADYYSLSTVVQGAPSMKQGYRFVTDMTNTGGFTTLELAAFDNYIAQ